MRDFIYIYFHMVKTIQKYLLEADVKINMNEEGYTSILTYNSFTQAFETYITFDTLSEFISWVESIE